MSIRIYGATSGYVDLDAPAVAGSASVTLPGSGTLATQAYADGLAGLTLITTQTFSAVTSISLNGVFTASYQNYLVTLTMTSAAQSLVTMRMRSSGSDASGANYNVQALNVSNTTVAGVQSLSGTSFRVSTSESSGTTVSQIFIGAPFDSTNTSVTAMNGRLTNTIEIDLRVGNHTVAQSYDGFTVIGSTSISGTVRVYGYKN